MISNESYDLVVIGGGINGAGIAADAAGRGLSVLLCEQNDLASATSSNSSKLIHGGLRYLEYGEFRLVREALSEREILLNIAPHIVRPLRFRLPHHPHLRPAWMIRAALFIYDHLAKRVRLPGSTRVEFDQNSPLISTIHQGFEYSDALVDDARLVILNAMAAAEHGGVILTKTKCINARRSDDRWDITLHNIAADTTKLITAKALVNATGPWVNRLFGEALHLTSPQPIRLDKGSHIIVPRLHNQPEAYILQTEDGRIVFVIPYEDKFSLVGTTDVEFVGDPAKVTINKEEINYLLAVINSHFKHQTGVGDIVETYSGVRTLLDDDSASAQAVSRDYSLEFETVANKAPLLSVFGGKITTYRKLSEAAVDRLCPYISHDGPTASASWTAQRRLPGGDFVSIMSLNNRLAAQYPWLAARLLTRYIRTYGSYTTRLLGSITSEQEMGRHFGADLYECEIRYLFKHEWALCCEDIIWRRTKLGLHLSALQIAAVDNFINQCIIVKNQQKTTVIPLNARTPLKVSAKESQR